MTRSHWVVLVALVVGLALVVAAALTENDTSRRFGAVEPCRTVPVPVVVDLDPAKHSEIILHMREAIQKGQPRILVLDRKDADLHRTQSLAHVRKKPGFQRDEYPPAVSEQGGTGADVKYVNPTQNSSSGAIMGARLRIFCDGQQFIVDEGTP